MGSVSRSQKWILLVFSQLKCQCQGVSKIHVKRVSQGVEGSFVKGSLVRYDVQFSQRFWAGSPLFSKTFSCKGNQTLLVLFRHRHMSSVCLMEPFERNMLLMQPLFCASLLLFRTRSWQPCAQRMRNSERGSENLRGLLGFSTQRVFFRLWNSELPNNPGDVWRGGYSSYPQFGGIYGNFIYVLLRDFPENTSTSALFGLVI